MNPPVHAPSELDRFELVATFVVARAHAGDTRVADGTVLVPLALKLQTKQVARTPYPTLIPDATSELSVVAVKRRSPRTPRAPANAWPVVKSGAQVLVLANRPAPDASLADTLLGAASVTDLANPAVPHIATDLPLAAALDADIAAGKTLADPTIRARYTARPATLGPLAARHLCARAASTDATTRAQLLHPLLLARDMPAPTRAALLRGVVEHATPRVPTSAEHASLLRTLFSVLAEPAGTAPQGQVAETFLPYTLAIGSAPSATTVFPTAGERASARSALQRHARTRPDHPGLRWLGTEAA